MQTVETTLRPEYREIIGAAACVMLGGPMG